ncbi:hypothetical protein EON79_09780 [bacterium]|nr:MAG: hypothetical protein EON79_09780 [bacterium]
MSPRPGRAARTPRYTVEIIRRSTRKATPARSPGSSLGKGVLCKAYMTALLSFAAFASIGSGATLSQEPAPAVPARESIPMYVSEDHMVVMLRLGDHPPAPVIFDTGTTGNVLDQVYAKRLGLPEVRATTTTDGTLGQTVKGYETSLKGARLGGVAIGDETAVVLDYPLGDMVGIFGPFNFPGRLLTLDFERSRILIETKTPATTPKGPGIPYAEDGLPQLPLTLAGTEIMATLDSGNNSPLLLPTSLAKRLPLRGPLVPVGQSVSAAGTQTTYQARLKGKVRVASVELKDPEILFVDNTVPNVGFPLIRRLGLTFDPTGGRMWISGKSPLLIRIL